MFSEFSFWVNHACKLGYIMLTGVHVSGRNLQLGSGFTVVLSTFEEIRFLVLLDLFFALGCSMS